MGSERAHLSCNGFKGLLTIVVAGIIIKIISAPKARPHRAAGAHEAHIGPDRALRRVNDAFIRVPTAECTRAVHLSVLPLNSATEGAEFKFVLRTARQVERMSVAQDRREG